MDIFDRLKKDEVKPVLKSQVQLSVVSPIKEKDIFDRLKDELPGLLKKYIKPEKKEVELSDEIVSLIMNEVAKIKPTEKIVEKVIEKKIVEKQVPIKPKEVDVEAIKAEFDKKLEESISKFKKEWEKEHDGVRMVVTQAPLPDMKDHVGDFLTVENSVNGLRAKWGVGGGLTDGVDVNVPNTNILVQGIIFQPVAGTYFKLDCKATGELQTTQVNP